MRLRGVLDVVERCAGVLGWPPAEWSNRAVRSVRRSVGAIRTPGRLRSGLVISGPEPARRRTTRGRAHDLVDRLGTPDAHRVREERPGRSPPHLVAGWILGGLYRRFLLTSQTARS